MTSKRDKGGVWIPQVEYDRLIRLLKKIETQLREMSAFRSSDPEVRAHLQPWRRQLLETIEKVQGQK